MSLNALKIRIRRWQARRRFKRRPLCRICNNLNYKGHQRTDPKDNELTLDFEFPEFDRDCPFCGLVVSSIQSFVDKDCWNARLIDPENGKERGTIITLRLEKDEPITGLFIFWHENSTQTKLDVHNTVARKTGIGRSEIRFIMYSTNEVFPSPSHPDI